MYKESISNLHNLIFSPKDYIYELVNSKSIKSKDINVFFLSVILILTLIQVFKNIDVFGHNNPIDSTLYLGAFIIGVLAFIILRIYMIKMIFSKVGIKFRYKDLAILVGSALIPRMIMSIVSLIVSDGYFDPVFDLVSQVWSFVIISIGIHVLTNLKTAKIILLVGCIYGFELIIELAFAGMI